MPSISRITGDESNEWPAPLRWASEYLTEYFTDAPSSFHLELMRVLEDPLQRLIARVAPRGHAKSTCAALAYPLWCICQRRRRNIVIVTHEASLAIQFVRDIRQELETNERILDAYGDLCHAEERHEGTEARRHEGWRAGVSPAAERHEGTEARRHEGGSAGVSPAAERHEGTEARRHEGGSAGVSPAAERHEGGEGEQGTGNREQAGGGRHAGTEARRHEGEEGEHSSGGRHRGARASAAGGRDGEHRRPGGARRRAGGASDQNPGRPSRRSGADSRRDRRTLRRAWSQSKFTTVTGITVQAKGTGAGFRGLRVGPRRPDLIICDDLEKDEHVATAEQRRKLENWLRRVVMPALAPEGQLLVLGSLIHYDALLANLRDRTRFPRWDYAVYRALEAEALPDGTFRRVALWPARWPVEKLDVERERIGTLAFEQEYQANPIDDTLRVFRPEWLKRYDPEEIAGKALIHLMAVDPATGTTAGDYFALWVGGVDPRDGVIYTRVLALERIGVVEQVRRIIAAHETWRPVKIGVETVGYQAALKEILDDESRRRGLYLPIVGLQTTSNKRARIEGASAFFENGTIRLPRALPSEVESQFLHFPKTRHDDAPDVCAMGIELARSIRNLRVETLVETHSRDNRRRGW